METFEDPPTYNRTNKFTKGFQTLIDAYGVASYREMNPAPYTIITFPFLFAVMFGDTGHGLLMFLFGAWMVLKEKPLAAKKSDNEIWNIFFGGRYIIFLMGLFSMYTGLIYNDMFSKSLNIFGSKWHNNYELKNLTETNSLALDPVYAYGKSPYAIGVDPVWQISQNKIIFLNSYKMKISIIFGVVHMLFGIFVGLWNHLYFKKRINIICEFIPQIMFLTFLFVYMTFLMLIKWIKYGPDNEVKSGPYCAPSVLITFINMILCKDGVYPPVCGSEYMFPGQYYVQKLLLVMALLTIPWMLFGKPIMLIKERKSKHMQLNNHGIENGDGEVGAGTIIQNPLAPKEEEEEEEISDLFIHQAIHTIEYVLGSVSHTASYLRLWALSLAHARKFFFFLFS